MFHRELVSNDVVRWAMQNGFLGSVFGKKWVKQNRMALILRLSETLISRMHCNFIRRTSRSYLTREPT